MNTIQELEAWFLADMNCLNQKFSRLKLKDISKPENIKSPKEHIERLSCGKKSRPRYIHNIHNPELAKILDIEKVRKKCPAFSPFYDFVSKL